VTTAEAEAQAAEIPPPAPDAVDVPRRRRWARVRDLDPRGVTAFALLVLLFFVCFRFDPIYGLVTDALGIDALQDVDDWIVGTQSMSDAQVIGRLAIDEHSGLFSEHLQMSAFPPGNVDTYDSQFGLAGWLLAAIAHLGPGDVATGTEVMISVASLASAVLAAGFVWGTRRFLSTGAAVLVAIGLLQPWSMGFAKSIYWTMPVKCLPGVVALLALRAGWSLRRTCAGIFLAGTFAFLSGYEYATVIASLVVGAVVLVEVAADRPARELWRTLAATVGALLASFGAAVVLHVAQLSLKYDSLSEGWRIFEETVTKRTGASGIVVDSVYQESLAAKPLDVLDTYLSMPVFFDPARVPLVQSFTVATLIVVCVLLVVFGPVLREHPRCGRNWWAASLAWMVTLTGPIGWHLLARPHSYIHTPLNYVLWFLPTIPLGLALLWGPIRAGTDVIRRDRSDAGLGLAVLVALLLCLAFSWISVR
jgi:hypothetical protein